MSCLRSRSGHPLARPLPKDLEPIIGKSNRVYEVLSRKRPLPLAMIRRLHQSPGMPADVLIAETVAR
ncbi:MAG: DNA-binding protein [Proteobacteria bacterium]|nr:DNA-binding protein [Pseudomonadota bacterium]